MEDNVSVKSEPLELGEEPEYLEEYLDDEYLEQLVWSDGPADTVKLEPPDDSPEQFTWDNIPADTVKVESPVQGRAKYECDVCGKGFRRIYPLIDHLKRHIHTNTGETRFCFRCSLEFHRAEYPKHIRLVHHTHECPFPGCLRTYAYHSSLYRHTQDRHSDAPAESTLQCDLCKKFYKSKQSIRVHLTYTHRQHKGHYKCHICKKIFTSKRQRVRHRYKVHNTRQFKCETCGRVYKGKDRLIRHIGLVHSNKPRLSLLCSECPKKFITRSYLAKHRKTMHSTPKECKLCHKVLKSTFCLYKHMEKRHDVERFECHVCGKVLRKEYTLQVHFKKFHQNTKKS